MIIKNMNLLSRVNRILLLVQCLIRALFHGTATKIPSRVSDIIVVPTGKLGDIICATPVLHAIRVHLPKARVIVVGNSKLRRLLLSDSGLADEYLDLEEDGTVERIKKYHPEVAIVTGPSFQLAATLYLAGIPLVIAPTPVGGVAHDITRPYKILQKLIKVFPHQIDGYAPRERLKSLEPLGIFTDDTTKHLGFSEIAEKRAIEIISQICEPYKYIVGIAAGSGNKEKQWHPKKFAQVANHLIEKFSAHIFVIGGKNDLLESNEIMLAIKNKSMVTDTTSVSIDELKAIISKLDVFISVNTGPLYIAEAFNVPTVDILGPVNPWDQPPQGKIHKMVFPPGGPRPLLCIMNTRNHDIKEAERIAESTRLEDVVSAAEEALKEADERILSKKG